MRVAFINHHGGVPGGGERSLEVYLRRTPGDIEPYVFFFEDGPFAQELRNLNLRVCVVPASQRLMSLTRDSLRMRFALDTLQLVHRLRRLLKANDIDVVVTSSMKAHIVGAIAARLCGIPAVTWLKDLPQGFALDLIRAVSRTCARERIACSRAVARRLGLSHTTALLPAMNLSRYAQLPSRDQARLSLGLPRQKLIFSIVGRIAKWKGQDRFLHAAAIVSARLSHVHFAVIGSAVFPQDREFALELQALAVQLGISDCVSFIPWLTDPVVAYMASDLICNASDAEPFGRTSAEAAACGVPTLCFDDGGASEAVLPAVSGTVVPAGDVDALATAMVAYAAEPASLRRAGAAARVYVQRQDVDRVSETFFDIVRRAHSGGSAALLTTSPSAIRDTRLTVAPVEK